MPRPRLELLAEDKLDMRIPDNSGRQVTDVVLSGNGDQASPLPIKKWGIDEWPIEVELSKDAGRFICNETYFRTLEALENHKFAIPCLFLHPSKNRILLSTRRNDTHSATSAHMLYKPSIKVAAGFSLLRKASLRCDVVMTNRNQEMGIPGGTIEADETPEQAIVRELDEELSIEANIVKKAGVWHHTYPFIHVEIHAYIVESQTWMHFNFRCIVK